MDGQIRRDGLARILRLARAADMENLIGMIHEILHGTRLSEAKEPRMHKEEETALKVAPEGGCTLNKDKKRAVAKTL